MLLFHVRGSADSPVRLGQARAFLDLVNQSVQSGKTPYASLLREETDTLRSEADSYLFHEFLEEVNSPVYFHQFIEQAADHGLQYLEEATPSPFMVSAEVMAMIRKTATDLISGEQYLDFLRGRSFRRTLLCHEETVLERPPDSQRLRRYYVTGLVRPKVTDREPPPAGEVEEFETAKGSSLSTNNPILRAVFHHLFKAWPRAVHFEELWDAALSHLGDARPSDVSHTLLTVPLLQCFMTGVVELHLRPPRFKLEVSERPLASPLARLQAQNSTRVTNLRHYSVGLNALDRQVLQHLDGSHDRAFLRETLAHTFSSEAPAGHVDELETSLCRLASCSLLLG
jgi:methyltransferase-like protein